MHKTRGKKHGVDGFGLNNLLSFYKKTYLE